jgi:hypothetical protein
MWGKTKNSSNMSEKEMNSEKEILNEKEELAQNQETENHEQILEEDEITLDCEASTKARFKKTNELIIEARQIQELDLIEKLFGNASSTYVTRDQLNDLASEISTSLNIIEDIEMPESEFNQVFIEEIIKQITQNGFSTVSIDNALSSLSKYSTNFDQDLKPDEIKSELSKILEVKKDGNKERIVLNKEYLEDLKRRESNSNSVSVGGTKGPLSIQASVSWAKDNSNESMNSNKSLSDQLTELNKETHNDIEWKFDGNKIIPKSLNVARLQKSSFSSLLKKKGGLVYLSFAFF